MKKVFMQERLSIIRLNPGNLLILGKTDKTIWTVLGSCLAVTLHAPELFSAVYHAQLPARFESGFQCIEPCPHPCFNIQEDSNEFRFVACALEFMINELEKRKIPFPMVHATFAGGASSLFNADSSESVGGRNIDVARKILARHGLVVNREHVGGIEDRTLRYFTADNRLLVQIHGRSDYIEI